MKSSESGKTTSVDSYSFGNSKGPRGARPMQDFNVANSPHCVGRYTIFPTKEMTVEKFNELYKLLPWEF